MENLSKYEQRGVSADKSEVHAAIKNMDKGLFPNAFCKVLPDLVAGDSEYCNLMHADTAGTKTSLAYLQWRETGDLSVWANIIQDSLVMNLDDLACVGLLNDYIVSSTIGRNKRLITAEVLSALINGTANLAQHWAAQGIRLHLSGGETADVGDIVRTVDVGFTVFGRMKRADVLENNIQVGDVIVGIASDGQSTYETKYTSGIGSNGLTGARHDVLSKYYAENFPEAYDTALPENVVFTGAHRLTDIYHHLERNYRVGDLLLSPTRTYIPLLQRLFAELRPVINGIIHCTGGGQTKVIKFIKNRHIIKDNLLPIPPVFRLIQTASNTAWREMYQVFNMGHRLEIYLPEAEAQKVIDLANSFDMHAQIVGRVEACDTERVTVKTAYGEFVYDK